MRRFWKSTDAPPLENSLYPPPRVYVLILWVAAFNALLIVAGVTLIAVAGEAYFRLTVPYGFAANPKDFGGNKWRFVPNVGRALEPNSEVRYSNHRGYWVITQSNRFGFLDRSPIEAKRAAESCHIAIMGDSLTQNRGACIRQQRFW